jgi:uncharacterized protein YndB with AHSA1/START domain
VPYDYTLTAIIPASPREIYEAWLDSAKHSGMTGAEARMSDEIGGEVSAWEGYITGCNLELVPHQRIVQSWRTTAFTDDHGDSIITVILEDDDGGTLLTLVHSNVPEGQRQQALPLSSSCSTRFSSCRDSASRSPACRRSCSGLPTLIR